MIASQEEVAQVLVDEGFEPKPYQDHLGVWTIGHGLTFLTENESKYIVEHFRLPKIEQDLQERFFWYEHSHPEVQRIVLNMAYQMGVTGVSNFVGMIAALKTQDYETAAKEMQDSRWYRQTPNRADRLIARMRGIL